MNQKIPVTYVTSSAFKREELEEVCSSIEWVDGKLIGDMFEFRLMSVPIKETLEIDLATMVAAEARAAYASIRVPCIVEHAGLIIEGAAEAGFPGGLTKPMWNALGPDFATRTASAGAAATARAVIGYCDGKRVHTFVGDTTGTMAGSPRGSRSFYWDTVFIPDGPDGTRGTRTYAEIVEQDGLAAKLKDHSQSVKALKLFLAYRVLNRPDLWPPA